MLANMNADHPRTTSYRSNLCEKSKIQKTCAAAKYQTATVGGSLLPRSNDSCPNLKNLGLYLQH